MCEHISGGVNIYLYEYVSLLAHEYVVCVCVYVILNQSAGGGGGVDKNWKREGVVGNIEGLHKIERLAPIFQLLPPPPIPGFPPFLVKISHPPNYSHFWKIPSPTIVYEERRFGLCDSFL